jgi:Flp pilus assembly protein TadG
MRTHFRPHSRRRRSRGVTAVEFALVAPLFFGALFGGIDGGLLLFSANAVNHATGIGMITLAQEGNAIGTDTDAITAMEASGFASTGLAKVDEIDIYLVHINQATGVVTQDTNSCSGNPCIDKYTALGVPIGTVVWPPGSRSTNSSSLTDMGITLKCHYSYLAFNSSRINLTFTRYFPVEPQS